MAERRNKRSAGSAGKSDSVRKARWQAKATQAAKPVTPEDIIRARRRRLNNQADIISFAVRLASMAVLLWVLFGVVFGVAVMGDEDMAPRLSAGDLMLYYRLEDSFSSQDIVVFVKDGEQFVGRIVARGGDTVEVTDQATLVINGSTVIESDIYYSTPAYDSDVTYPLTLAEDELFILCDYREGAEDSRSFGAVKVSEVKGKVITVIRRSNL